MMNVQKNARALFSAMTVVIAICLGLGMAPTWGMCPAVDKDDPVAVSRLEKIGGRLERGAPGENGAGMVVEAWFAGDPIADDDIEQLHGLPCLRTLILLNTKVTDKGLAKISTLGQLLELRVPDAATDEGLVHVAKMSQLNALCLPKSITDKGIKTISSLDNLRKLVAVGAPVTNEGLAHLAKCAELEHLVLDGSKIDDAGLVHLKNLTKLRYLSLSKTRITDLGVAGLPELPALESLDLDNTRIGDATLQTLLKRKSLRSLGVQHTQVTQKGWENAVKAMPQAQVVSVFSRATRAKGEEHNEQEPESSRSK